jgi:alpha-N-acetylglucosaminidase
VRSARKTRTRREWPVPAFAGFVPEGIRRIAPAAAVHQTLWNSGFPASKRPWFLLPTDPLFSEIAESYRREWRDEFGAADFFLSHRFNELDVPTDGGTLADALADYGEIIGNTITADDPDSTWFIQGWMFGYQRNIWINTTVAALLSRLPDAAVLVKDAACDYNADSWGNGMNWKLFNAFHGKRWTHGS